MRYGLSGIFSPAALFLRTAIENQVGLWYNGECKQCAGKPAQIEMGGKT